MVQHLSHPYIPDLSPPAYFLFPKLKMNLKGLHFTGVAEIHEAVIDEFKKVKKEGNFDKFSENVRRRKSL
jgi:hypothetical protein